MGHASIQVVDSEGKLLAEWKTHDDGTHEQNPMAGTNPNHSDSGPIHDASQYVVAEVDVLALMDALRRADDKYDTLLQRWKEEQQLRLKAESDRGVLAAQITGLQAKLRRVMDAAQELRALL